jgi:hypothetical protein
VDGVHANAQQQHADNDELLLTACNACLAALASSRRCNRLPVHKINTYNLLAAAAAVPRLTSPLIRCCCSEALGILGPHEVLQVHVDWHLEQQQQQQQQQWQNTTGDQQFQGRSIEDKLHAVMQSVNRPSGWPLYTDTAHTLQQ